MTTKDNAGVCFECGGPLVLEGSGSSFTYCRGSDLELPPDFLVPTCTKCGAEFFDEELEKKARELIQPIFLERQTKHLKFLLARIQDKTHMSMREIEKACGVLGTSLTPILSGEIEASDTLVGLLESFARYPAEAKRRLSRNGMHDTGLLYNALAEDELWIVDTVKTGAREVLVWWDGEKAFISGDRFYFWVSDDDLGSNYVTCIPSPQALDGLRRGEVTVRDVFRRGRQGSRVRETEEGFNVTDTYPLWWSDVEELPDVALYPKIDITDDHNTHPCGV
jgi:hypothetical protein